VAPYLALCREDATQREHSLRAVFNGLRYIVKTGNQWRMMPHDLPPWPVVYQQMRRRMDAGCFEIMVEDMRMLLREFAGRKSQPTAMILEAAPCNLRRNQAHERAATEPSAVGIEGTCGSGHAGASARLACDSGR
jgi:transposase